MRILLEVLRCQAAMHTRPWDPFRQLRCINPSPPRSRGLPMEQLLSRTAPGAAFMRLPVVAWWELRSATSLLLLSIHTSCKRSRLSRLLRSTHRCRTRTRHLQLCWIHTRCICSNKRWQQLRWLLRECMQALPIHSSDEVLASSWCVDKGIIYLQYNSRFRYPFAMIQIHAVKFRQFTPHARTLRVAIWELLLAQLCVSILIVCQQI
jgi:hypothetical protein